MPRISEFFGIVIEMFWNDHGTPHFHAKYAEFKASIAIDKLDVRGGYLPPRQLSRVREWASPELVSIHAR
jgi:hypothetical protein